MNLGMIAVFGLTHSGMIGMAFKSACVSMWPQSAVLERAIYVFVAICQLLSIIMFYQPIPTVLYDYHSTTTALLSYAALACVLYAMTTVIRLMGEGDVMGKGRYRYMIPTGFEYPINVKWS
jgi:hypothetical protein